ncbi:MAG: hypothetical protein SAqBPW_27450 [Shewanella algae]|nr:hypothetical protein TUM17386_12870 [Shewanella algae]
MPKTSTLFYRVGCTQGDHRCGLGANSVHIASNAYSLVLFSFKKIYNFNKTNTG